MTAPMVRPVPVSQGIVGVIFDLVIFSALPNGISLVLSNKRCETTNRNRAFAELGLKAAISVNAFQSLDSDKDGKLGLPELTSIFGSVEQVDQQRALMIAQTVLEHSNTCELLTHPPSLSQPSCSLSFDSITFGIA
jgi:hypothetical protein